MGQESQGLTGSGPACALAADASSPLSSACPQDSSSRGAAWTQRGAGTEWLLALRARERLEHPLAPCLRQLAERVVEQLFARVGAIREALLLDAGAIYEGDPAAQSVDEVILAYPGFLAIAIYRIAHELHDRVPVFARLLTDVAHGATGIDIHPGVRIGGSFAIDRGYRDRDR